MVVCFCPAHHIKNISLFFIRMLDAFHFKPHLHINNDINTYELNIFIYKYYNIRALTNKFSQTYGTQSCIQPLISPLYLNFVVYNNLLNDQRRPTISAALFIAVFSHLSFLIIKNIPIIEILNSLHFSFFPFWISASCLSP